MSKEQVSVRLEHSKKSDEKEKKRGKFTFINSLANHLWDVKVVDRFRFMIADKETAKAYVLNNTKLDYNVTVVDIPGFEEEETASLFLQELEQD